MFEGPFRWHEDPNDPTVRYGDLIRHWYSQGRIIELWHLPGGQGPVIQYSHFDGVLLLLTEERNICVVDTQECENGQYTVRNRQVWQLSQIYLDGFLSKEEYEEIKLETETIKGNIAEAKAAEEHRRLIIRLRGEAVDPYWFEVRSLTQEIRQPWLSKSKVKSVLSALRVARTEIQRLESLSDKNLFAHVKTRRLSDLRRKFFEVKSADPPDVCLVGEIYLAIQAVEASTTPEEYFRC